MPPSEVAPSSGCSPGRLLPLSDVPLDVVVPQAIARKSCKRRRRKFLLEKSHFPYTGSHFWCDHDQGYFSIIGSHIAASRGCSPVRLLLLRADGNPDSEVRFCDCKNRYLVTLLSSRLHETRAKSPSIDFYNEKNTCSKNGRRAVRQERQVQRPSSSKEAPLCCCSSCGLLPRAVAPLSGCSLERLLT